MYHKLPFKVSAMDKAQTPLILNMLKSNENNSKYWNNTWLAIDHYNLETFT